jgi:sec-independent protein translocase protein TatC
VFPVIFAFFTSTAPEGVLVMTDISSYLSFVLKLFFAFGLAFEVPVATVLLVRMGMTTPESLAAKRPYIIVGAFVVGMLMTPPDIFSQLMLAIPVWVLFELGLYVSKSIKPQTRAQADAASVEDEALDREMEAGIAEFDRLDDDDPSSRS